MFGRNLLGRFTSLESDMPEDDLEIESPEEGTDETGAQLDGENIVEGDLVEAAEDEAEINEADDEAEELEDTSESLESFLMAAQLGKAQGGWTEGEALAYGLGLDATLKRLGGSSSDLMPSLESFGGSRERLESTISVENKIKDAIISIWEAIKRAVNKVVAFVRKWYVKIFDGASRLKKRAEAIRKKAENTTGSAKEKKIATSTLSQLHKSKSMPSAKDLVDAINAVTDTVKSLTNDRLESNYGDTVDAVVKTLNDTADGEGKISQNDAVSALVSIRSSKIFALDLNHVKNKGSKDEIARVSMTATSQNEYVDLYQSGELPGGKRLQYLKITNSKGNVENGQYGRNVASALRVAGKVMVNEYSNKKVEIDNSKQVAILTPSEVVAIADATVDFCQVVVDYKLGFDKYEKKNSAALGKVDALLRKANNKEDDKDGRQRGEFVRGLAQGLGSLIRNRGTSITNVIGYGMTLTRNSMVFGVQSLGQYKD